MNNDYDLGELNRQVANMLRIGKVTELDEENARVKVQAAGLDSDWLPWGAGRAGATKRWSMPQLGEQVIIASPYGDTAQGVIIGSLFSDDNPAPAASKDQETTTYPDGSTVDYNSASNTLTVTIAGGGNVIINAKAVTVNTETADIVASSGVTLDTPETHCTGNLIVDGSLTFAGGMTGSGGATTATINGNVQVNGNLNSSGVITDSNGDGGA